MGKIVAALALALLSCAGAYASSPAIPIQRNSSSPHQAPIRTLGTKESPLFLDGVVTTQRSEHQTNWEKRESESKSASDAALVEFTKWLFIATAALGGIALLQAGLFVWQLLYMRKGLSDSETAANAARVSADAAKKSADVGEQGMVAQNRAYVHAINIIGEWRLDADTNQYWWAFRAILSNTGNTPTKDLRLYCKCELRDAPLPKGYGFESPSDQEGTGLMPPRGENRSALAPQNWSEQLTPQDIHDVQQGHKYLYYWGWMRYRDIFPNSPVHMTAYCWQVFPRGDAFAFTPSAKPGDAGFMGWETRHHSEGNYTKEEAA